MSKEEKDVKSAPAPIKTIKPVTPAKPGEVPADKKKEKPLTPAEIEAKKDDWWRRHREKMKEEKDRRKEFETTSPEELSDDAELPADEEVAEDDNTSIKKVKQTKICRKYGINQKKLRKAAALVEELIAARVVGQIEAEYIFALVELMTRGDIK